MADRYHIAEIFASIQGEGWLTGTPMVFVRFARCNLWSGKESERESAAKRSGAQCPLWCDTNFALTETLTRSALIHRITSVAQGIRWVCFTGGEPILQLDYALLQWCQVAGLLVAAETNGTIDVGARLTLIDWLCVSPKTSKTSISQRKGHELKVAFPAYDPCDFDALAKNFNQRSVLPVEERDEDVGKNWKAAVEFVMANPSWRLTVQTHKILDLR